MPKKKNWFHLIKRFIFFREAEEQDRGKRSKKGRWFFFGKLKTKRPPPSIVAPPVVLDKKRRSPQEGDSGEHRALDAAIAYAAAAEAAVAAAKKAAEVLTITTDSPHESETIEQQHETKGLEFYEDETKCSSGLTCMHERMMQDVAAIKIQTAFRGYLARKALRALRGLVKLQAIIRGRAVRHQAVTTLKCLQSIVHIQSQIRARRSLTAHGNSHPDDEFGVQDRRDEKLMAELSGHRKWDHSPLTQDEVNAVISNKKEAILRRERMKAYSFNYRSSTESEDGKTDGRLKYWLEQYAIRQEHKNDAFKRLDTDEDKHQREVVRTKHDQIQGLDSPILLRPRRSYDRKKQRSIGEDNLFTGSSPLVPTYMAATESAKARVRSTSSPRLRPVLSDSFSDSNSPYKHKFSPISSINSEVTCNGRSVKHCITATSQQRSPGLKGLPCPGRSSRTLKDICSESESSVHGNWESGTLE